MKKVMISLIVILMFVPLVVVEAQELIPPIGVGSASIKFHGFSHQVFDESRDASEEWQCKLLRLYTELETSRLSLFIQTRIVDGGVFGKDFLKQARLSCKISECWEARAGRLFIGAGHTTPSPSALETVDYPRLPYGCFGYGIQVEGIIGDTWGILADITGATDVPFDAFTSDDDEKETNLDRVEFSTRITKAIGSDLVLGATSQLTGKFQRGGLDADYKVNGCIHSKGAIYMANEEENKEKGTGDSYGCYLFIGVTPLERLEFHSQIDACALDVPNDDPVRNVLFTNGIRCWTKDDQLSLTLDYEVVFGDSDNPHSEGSKSRALARVQFRF